MTASAFTRPTLDQWLTDKGRDNKVEVEAFVPFLLISYSYDRFIGGVETDQQHPPVSVVGHI